MQMFFLNLFTRCNHYYFFIFSNWSEYRRKNVYVSGWNCLCCTLDLIKIECNLNKIFCLWDLFSKIICEISKWFHFIFLQILFSICLRIWKILLSMIAIGEWRQSNDNIDRKPNIHFNKRMLRRKDKTENDYLFLFRYPSNQIYLQKL